ncbi:hypothetical protein E2I00_013736 [Balaenoptera physalus]|uniref:SH2 domain-containing protein n=1 Tax=Balaenoptera physalus TaxID=9770 RepID=A0A6A1QFL4_BALPH|nr:hypothetical protein E2I00_013736 [Balaenoptera physalus]
MVHDIKNNEGGIMNKIKKLKVKAPPSVPQRDYASVPEANRFPNPLSQAGECVDLGDADLQRAEDRKGQRPPEVSKRVTTVPLVECSACCAGGAARTPDSSPGCTLILSLQTHRIQPPLGLEVHEFPQDSSPGDNDSDYENPDEHSDSEMYVLPAEEPGDDSYEPPPAEQETRPVHRALPFTRGEYVDNRSSQRQSPPSSKTLPSKPNWPSAKARQATTLPASTSLHKPQVPPRPKELLEDEADYVVPVEDADENYIHPTEDSRKSGAWDSKSTSSPAAPSPLPRAGKKTATPLKTILAFLFFLNRLQLSLNRMPQVFVKKNLYLLNATEGLVTDKKICSHKFFLLLPRNQFIKNPYLCQEADVHCKPWYAGACDRKSAEEALYRSNKDGSFLIRKSSGHDSKQPYTLVVFFNKRVYNIPVRFIEATKQYALGRKKTGEEYFGSVAEIIKNHQHSPLVLIDSQNNTKDSTRLKYAVNEKVPKLHILDYESSSNKIEDEEAVEVVVDFLIRSSHGHVLLPDLMNC